MSIIYSLVSCGSTILAEYTDKTGNFTTITQTILDKIPPQNAKMTYVYDRHLFHYIAEDGFVYLCMADEAFGRRVPFAFLLDVKSRFESTYKARARTAFAYGLNRELAPILKQQMEYYSQNPNSDRINQVRNEIAQVKDVMVQNIEKVLERGERIDLLVDKADNLNQAAFQFKKSSTKLKRNFCWQNARLTIIIVIVVAVILTLIILLATGKI
ncbi:vesicle-associated membrane protein [Capsaspora owczarzaki ATCC 30864]|uniref:Vesicle-associated membrane protein n=1 Tax=Capsaspora owczarzaki (strain ATCC 30864) TaxID=595528 RepID=A0A0D2W0J6_CAPO3|nr:vesicle-associated membrane protein [Capsaspora owczarzaki ATCC 30864]KJE97732.1 vesicle-associated membrane protein [Capsaspora owczarzaki ATCC 30864]|eukprot:XP_004342909.1 vesicle-associated membrane protein [Capsaspora owczarzaki ATCC 30864]